MQVGAYLCLAAVITTGCITPAPTYQGDCRPPEEVADWLGVELTPFEVVGQNWHHLMPWDMIGWPIDDPPSIEITGWVGAGSASIPTHPGTSSGSLGLVVSRIGEDLRLEAQWEFDEQTGEFAVDFAGDEMVLDVTIEGVVSNLATR